MSLHLTQSAVYTQPPQPSLSIATICQEITQWVDCVGDKLPELLEMGGKKLFKGCSAKSYDLVACAPTAYRNNLPPSEKVVRPRATYALA